MENNEDFVDMSISEVKKVEYSKPLSMQKKYYPKKETEGERRRKKASEEMAPLEFLDKYLTSTTDTDKFVYVRKVLGVSPQNSVPFSAITHIEQYLEVMDAWQRGDEERMLLRTPIGQERRCVNDDNCEGTQIMAAKKVILKEACSFKDLEEFLKTRMWPQQRKPCRMCARKAVASDYFNFKGNREAARPDGSIHSHYNYINTEGEYAAQDVIMSSSFTHHGLFAPVVIHCRLYYRQYSKKTPEGEDVYYYDQYGYARPQVDCDVVFRSPSLPGATDQSSKMPQKGFLQLEDL